MGKLGSVSPYLENMLDRRAVEHVLQDLHSLQLVIGLPIGEGLKPHAVDHTPAVSNAALSVAFGIVVQSEYGHHMLLLAFWCSTSLAAVMYCIVKGTSAMTQEAAHHLVKYDLID